MGGSGMSDHAQWTIIGVVLVVIGVAMLGWAWRVRRDLQKNP
jgi:hypothetical protein